MAAKNRSSLLSDYLNKQKTAPAPVRSDVSEKKKKTSLLSDYLTKKNEGTALTAKQSADPREVLRFSGGSDLSSRITNPSVEKTDKSFLERFLESEKAEGDRRAARQAEYEKAVRDNIYNTYNSQLTPEFASEAAETLKAVAFTRNMPVIPASQRVKNAATGEFTAPAPRDETEILPAAVAAADLSEYKQKKAYYESLPASEEIQSKLDEAEKEIKEAKKDKLGAEFGILLGNRASYDQANERVQQLEAEKEKLGEEYNEARYGEYARLQYADDFGALSAYNSTENGGTHRVVESQSGVASDVTGFDDPLYDYVNKNEDVLTALREAQTSTASDSRAATFFGIDSSYIEQMTDDEVKTFNYIYAKESPEKAREYLEFLTSDLTRRQREQDAANYAEFAKEHPVLSSAYSAVASPLKSTAFVGQTVDILEDGKIDENASYNRLTNTNNTIRSTVSGMVEEKWGEAGSFVYQTGMGMADFLFTTAATGGFAFSGIEAAAVLPLAIMGTSSAADTVISAKERGLDDSQAYALGVIAGASEIITEKLSLDTLLEKIPFGNKNGVVSALTYVFKNSLAEGSEEVASDFINLFADVLISKDKSEWQTSMNAYIEQGMTEGEAFRKVFTDQMVQTALSFSGGALSGGVLSGAGALTQGVYAHATHSDMRVHKAIDGADAKGGNALNGELASLLFNAESATEETKVEQAANFVEAVSKAVPKSKNAINTAVDYLLEEAAALDAYSSGIDDSKIKAAVNEEKQAIRFVHETISNNKGEIKSILDSRANAATEESAKASAADTNAGDKGNAEDIADVPETNVGSVGTDGTVNASEPSTAAVQDEKAGEAVTSSTANNEADMGAETVVSEETNNTVNSAAPAVSDASDRHTAIKREIIENFDVEYSDNAEEVINGLLSRNGTYKLTLDSLVREANNIRNSDLDETEKAERIAVIQELDREIANKAQPIVQRKVNAMNVKLRKLGLPEVVVDSSLVMDYTEKKPREYAYFDPDDNSLHVSPYIADRGIYANYVVHEMTHLGEKYDPQFVRMLLDTKQMLLDNGYSGDIPSRQSIERNYADLVKDMGDAERTAYFDGEEAAHFLESVLTSDDIMYRLSKESDSVKNAFRRIMEAIREFFGIGKDAQTKENEAAARVVELIEKMLDDNAAVSKSRAAARKAARDGGKIKITASASTDDAEIAVTSRQENAVDDSIAEDNDSVKASDENIRYSRDIANSDSAAEFQREYEADVDKVLSGTYDSSDPLIIGRTPVVLEKIGLAQLPVTITPNHVYSIAKTADEARADGRYNKNVNYHGLGEAAVKDIMAKISDPIMVVVSPDFNTTHSKSRNSAHRLIALVDLSANGKQVIAPIEIDAAILSDGNWLDTNHIASYYEKDSVNKLISEVIALENIGEVSIYYGNKKRIGDFVKNLGFQLPAIFNDISDSDTIIRSVDENVNRKLKDVTQSQQFKRWFGDWQNDPENASKVVNEDGTPKVVYHGTDADFTVFNESDGGYWFSESEDYAESMAEERGGDNVMGVYLDMKNPYRATLPADQFTNPTYEAPIIREAKENGYDGVIIENETDSEYAADTFYVVFEREQIKSATDNIGTFDGRNSDIRYSRELDDENTPKITDGMTESERYDILKDRTIQLKAKTDYAKMLDMDEDLEDIETLPLTEKKKLLQRLGEQFGVFKGYQNADIELEFEYSRGGLKESVQKQNRKYENFAKMLSCFDDVIDSAVGIEVHNRNGEYKTDETLKNVYVLVGGFEDGDSIIPVKLEVKEFNTPKKSNALYVSIALGEIKKDRIVTTSDSDTSQKHVAPLSDISIADLFANVNTADGSFLKYIPDGFLDDSQRKAKTDYASREKAVSEKNNIRHSRELDESDFTYNNLVSKPDMKITALKTPEAFAGNSRPSRSDVIRAAIDNAREKNNPKNTIFNTYVRNKDTGTDILVGKNGIEHGLTRSYLKTALASAHIGDLIENAVLINEHTARDGNGEGGIYLSVGTDGDDLYLCRIITNDSNTMEEVEVLYALNTKKESAAHYRLGSGENLRSNTDSTISIADLLDLVKKYFADVLPEDVLRTMETERPASTVSDSVRYSRELETEDEKKIRHQQERIEYLEKQFRSHTALGWAKAVSPAARRKFASEIAAEIQGVTVEEVSAALKSVYDILEAPKRGSKDTAEVRWKEAYEAASEAARQLVENATANEINPLYEQYNDLRNRLRTTPIAMTISYNEFGGKEDYRRWRRGNVGLLRISDSAGAIPVDTFYQELSAQYPEFFPPEITNEADQLKRLGDAAVELKRVAGSRTQKVNPLEDIADSFAADLTNRILYGFDQLAKSTEGARREYGRMMNENDVRQAYAEGASDGLWASYERAYEEQKTVFEREIQRANKKVEQLQTKLIRQDARLGYAAARRSYKSYLTQINKMLTEPTKRKHIPDSIKPNVAAMLLKMEEDTAYGRAPANVIDSSLLRKIAGATNSNTDDSFKNGNAFYDHIMGLMHNIETIEEKMAEYGPEDYQKNPAEAEKNVTALETAYYNECTKVLKMLKNYIANGNRIFLMGKNLDAAEFGDDIKADMQMKMRYQANDERAQKEAVGDKVKRKTRKFAKENNYDMCSPAQYFSMYGESGEAIMGTLREAQTKDVRHRQAYADMLIETIPDDFIIDRSAKADIYVEIDGKKLNVSRAQLMSLYVSWKRPAARYHLEHGGASFLTGEGQELDQRTVRITEQTYTQLMKNLSDTDKRIADAVQRFLARIAGEWGNEASLQMYGYTMYNDPNYFPIRTTQNSRSAQDTWHDRAAISILENSGFTKSVKRGAANPIVIDNFFNVCERHVQDMSRYNAYAPICNDLGRILKQDGVSDSIKRGMGESGKRYLIDFIERLNHPSSFETKAGTKGFEIMKTLGNNAKRSAVGANLGTAFKQLTSVTRAFGRISPKYFVAPKKFDRKAAFEEMIEYSGAAKLKTLGYSDTGFARSMRQMYDKHYVNSAGALRGAMAENNIGRATLTAYDWVTNFNMALAAKMDEMTFVNIWNACRLEAKDKNPSVSHEKLMEITARKFNNVIGNTQVVDTILDKAPVSDALKGTSWGIFTNEPIKAYGLLISEYENMKDGRKGAKKRFAAELTGVLVSNIILEPLISAIRSMMRDEEDDTEQFWRKLLKKMTGIDLTGEKGEEEDDDKDALGIAIDVASSEMIDGLFAAIPIVGIVYGAIMDAAQGYSNAMFETEELENFVQLGIDLFDVSGNGVKTKKKVWTDFLTSGAQLLGLPARTVIKDAESLVRNVLNTFDQYEAVWEFNKLSYNLENGSARSQKGFYDILTSTYKSGDVETYQKMLAELKDIQKQTTIGVSWKDINDSITERGGKIEVGSPLWYTNMQAEYQLDTYVRAMKAEKTVTDVYKRALDAGYSEKNASAVLYKAPQNGDFTLDGEEVKMTLAESAEYIHDVGNMAYCITLELGSNYRWKELTLEQQMYAITKANDYAKTYYKKKYRSGVKLENWMNDLYDKSASASTVARACINRAVEEK